MFDGMNGVDLQDLKRRYQIVLFKLDLASRIRLWRKLEKLLADGVPILVALKSLRDLCKPGQATYLALDEWAVAMRSGQKFSQAIGPWVSPEEQMMMLAGDQSGQLAQALASTVKVAQSKEKIKSAVIAGLSYPAVLLAITLLGLYLFNFKIVPTFTQPFPNARWTGMAQVVIDFARFMDRWYFWLVLAVGVAIASVWASMPRWSGPSRVVFDRHVPYSIYRVTQGASWIIALAAMIEAGMRLESAMAHLMRNATPWGHERMAAALRSLKSGRNIGQALAQTGYEFPDREIISDLQVYASKSGFDEALRIIADEWIDQSVERIQRLMRQVFNVSLIGLTVLIAFQVSGVLSLQMQFSNQARTAVQ